MKIALAQTRPFLGDIPKNIEAHRKLINLAIAEKADLIFFPELSITGYEPQLAKQLAIRPEDEMLDAFQNICDQNNLSLGVGMPTVHEKGLMISMLIFKANFPRQTYSKRYLHPDEFPYFVEGDQQILIEQAGYTLAPAICYESVLSEHVAFAVDQGTNVYLASVAKSQKATDTAYAHYARIAKEYAITVLMVNSLGPCDDFVAVGQSAVWDPTGTLIAQLDDNLEGLLIWDSVSAEAPQCIQL